MAKPKNTTLMSSLKGDLDDLDISKQSKYYEIVRDLIQDIGKADEKRAKTLKNIGDELVKSVKLEKEIGKSTFQSKDLMDEIIQAKRDGNKEDVQRLRLADALNDKAKRQNEILTKQAKIAGDIGRKIESMFDNIPGGGLLSSLLGISGLGDALEKEMKIKMAGGGGGKNRGVLEETMGGIFGQSIGKAGQGTAEGFEELHGKGIFAKGKAAFGDKKKGGNMNSFLRSLTGMQLFGGLATVGAIIGAGVLLTKNLRAGMEKGLGVGGTGRPVMQQMFFGEQADAFENEFGKVDSMTQGLGLRLKVMAKFSGLTAENAAKLSKEMVISSDLTQEQSLDVMNITREMAKAAGVAPKAIFEDMAQNSSMFAQFAKDGAGGLAEAAIKAKTLGLNLGAVSSIASSLLDFESSISAEFEAQVLTGKMINLDRARGLALQGKASELLDEIVKQVGGEAELRSMNILGMQSLATAVGLSVGQLQRVVQGNELSEKNPVVSKLDETNEILRAQLDTEQRQLLGNQKQDTMVTFG